MLILELLLYISQELNSFVLTVGILMLHLCYFIRCCRSVTLHEDDAWCMTVLTQAHPEVEGEEYVTWNSLSLNLNSLQFGQRTYKMCNIVLREYFLWTFSRKWIRFKFWLSPSLGRRKGHFLCACPIHHPWFDRSNNIWSGLQITKLFIMQFSFFCYYVLSLRSKYSH
jgi:hypothetical protein